MAGAGEDLLAGLLSASRCWHHDFLKDPPADLQARVLTNRLGGKNIIRQVGKNLNHVWSAQ